MNSWCGITDEQHIRWLYNGLTFYVYFLLITSSSPWTCWDCKSVCDKALQSLGCSHVLEAYLQGLTVEGFASAASVREIQYEAACQNSKWDLELATRYYLSSLLFIQWLASYILFVFVFDIIHDALWLAWISTLAACVSVIQAVCQSLGCSQFCYMLWWMIKCVSFFK